MDVIHPLINLKGMGIIDGGVQDMLAAIREAHEAGKFVYAMKSLAGGNFVPDRAAALRFIFDTPEIDAVVVGMVTPLEVEWNLRFAAGRPIPEDLDRDTALSSKRLISWPWPARAAENAWSTVKTELWKSLTARRLSTTSAASSAATAPRTVSGWQSAWSKRVSGRGA